MRVWVVVGTDGGGDVFALAVYKQRERARKRVRRENDAGTYYEYQLHGSTLYAEPRKRKAKKR